MVKTKRMFLMKRKPKARSISNIMIEISGRTATGARFNTDFMLTFDQQEKTTEEAIIEAFGSGVKTFEELAIQQGWSQANWFYAPPVSRKLVHA